ncbi:MAG: galactokinase [Actinomycetota bacterium]|nr:galactokinase [Actinomycetota bacterium]
MVKETPSAGAARGVAGHFKQACGRPASGVWAAPGRVNLIGEHTDYNDGFVLPLAMQRQVFVAAAPAAGPRSTVRSMQRAGDVVAFDAGTVEPGGVAGWAAYVAGVFWALRTAGHDLLALDLLIDGDVPLGAGLSSSAALECAVAVMLADLIQLRAGPTDLAQQARRAENLFVGAPTGGMDQMAAMHGREGQLVFLDTRSLAVEHVPFDLPGRGLALLVLDTGAPHALVDSEYAQRRSTCEEAARSLGVPALRDVTLDDLDDALARLPDPVTRRRVRHVVTENARVLDTVAILRSGGDPREIGPLMTASHASLRDDFEVTVATLDVAAHAALDAGAYGARMTGGGFGGSVIALVEAARTDDVARTVTEEMGGAGFGRPQWFVALPSEGARRVLG